MLGSLQCECSYLEIQPLTVHLGRFEKGGRLAFTAGGAGEEFENQTRSQADIEFRHIFSNSDAPPRPLQKPGDIYAMLPSVPWTRLSCNVKDKDGGKSKGVSTDAGGAYWQREAAAIEEAPMVFGSTKDTPTYQEFVRPDSCHSGVSVFGAVDHATDAADASRRAWLNVSQLACVHFSAPAWGKPMGSGIFYQVFGNVYGAEFPANSEFNGDEEHDLGRLAIPAERVIWSNFSRLFGHVDIAGCMSGVIDAIGDTTVPSCAPR